MTTHKNHHIQNKVKEHYGQIAGGNKNLCCNPNVTCCGGGDTLLSADEISRGLGYTPDQLKDSPGGSNLGLGCGNPVAIADIKKGETVLDLGSGGGFDCFLAARRVGPTGRVIGVDMTSEMLDRARKNAAAAGYDNVDFRFGEIEKLPIPGNSIDLIMSNCVVNLAPDKSRVFAEAFRVLKPGGRLCISDFVATKPLPDEILTDLDAYVGCIAGAALIEDLVKILNTAGFDQVSIEPRCRSREFIKGWMPGSNVEDYVVSAVIRAVKP